MIQLFAGSFTLSLVHAVIPNHWMPMVIIGKTEKWGTVYTLFITFIAGVAHIISTILIGIFIGIFGYKLSQNFEILTKTLASLILIVLGVVYLIINFKSGHKHEHLNDKSISPKTKFSIIFSLCVMMFLSPCIEIEAYYFTAGIFGLKGILLVSIVYLIITPLSMLLLVFLSMKGIKKIKLHFFEHNEKSITGVLLIILGIFAYFVEI